MCLFLARRLLPDTPDAKPVRLGRLDPVGVVLLGAAVLALLPFVQSQQWPGNRKYLLVPVAAVLLAVFVWWERRCARAGNEPLIDLELFRVRSYWLGSLLILLYFAGFTSIFFVSTLYLQSGLHYSALQAGLTITPFALGSGIAAGIGGRLVDRFGRPSWWSAWRWWRSASPGRRSPCTRCPAGARAGPCSPRCSSRGSAAAW